MSGGAAPCVPCEMEQANPSAVVFRDPLWACEVVPGFDVPGWFVLRVRRHALRIQGLTDEELATYGRRARDIVAAVTEVTRAPVTYMLTFGEANPHFHSLALPGRGRSARPSRGRGLSTAERTRRLRRRVGPCAGGGGSLRAVRAHSDSAPDRRLTLDARLELRDTSGAIGAERLQL